MLEWGGKVMRAPIGRERELLKQLNDTTDEKEELRLIEELQNEAQKNEEIRKREREERRKRSKMKSKRKKKRKRKLKNKQ